MWRRPRGPPKVWRVMELTDPSGRKRKFSLQEIPEASYEEVISHMSSIFAKDEAMCSALNVTDDPETMHLLQEFWRMFLSQGISVGAFEIPEGGGKPILAGVNLLVYSDEETEKNAIMPHVKGPFGIIMSAVEETRKLADPRELYKVDRFLEAIGLSISPQYRRMGLAVKLLEIRDDIGKWYGLEYTSTLFTSSIAQAAATKAGYTTDVERLYDEIFPSDNNPFLPRLKGKSCKIMSKRIS
ncbi:uncharacterized protein [Fopius arisanus]|uniref:N-acetyltransferase domain-containing protein n=2 Tax=Fopius arisanus TaxID=64838 RepID=A0A9R1T4B3_9HYME|nr:PREDICTED: uncharacterized protein LOC105266192 [Fopius arisanus]